MLGEKVLPAGGIPTTAIIAVLVHGKRDQVAIYRSNVQEPEAVASWQEASKIQPSKPSGIGSLYDN